MRDRSRNKTTENITLWLCHCPNTPCPHKKQPAPLEEVTQIPQVGDSVCHYRKRSPRVVADHEVIDDKCYLLFEPIGNNPSEKLPRYAVNYYPAVGDEVLVSATPYCNWVEQEADKVRGEEKRPSRKYVQLIESLEDLWWTATVFTLRILRQDGMCVLVGDGQRKEVPIECLRVLNRKAVEQQERLAA